MNRRVAKVASIVVGSIVLITSNQGLVAQETASPQIITSTPRTIEVTPQPLPVPVTVQSVGPNQNELQKTPNAESNEAPMPGKTEVQPEGTAHLAPAGGETMLLPEEKIGEQGSWVKKRKWIEQALPLNNESQEAIGALEKDQKTFTAKYAEIQKVVDEFYRQTGFEQGKIGLLFTDIESYLEKKKKKQIEALAVQAEHEKDEKEVPVGYYDLKTIEIEEKAEDEKRALEQLNLDVKSIEELNNSLTDRLKKVDEERAQIFELASESRKKVDEMWYIIDDQKAKQSYYELKNINEKIKNIVQYIGVDLIQDFSTVIDRLKEQIEKINKTTKELEEKGYIIENRMKRVEVLRKEKQEKLKAQQKEQEAAHAAQASRKKVKEQPTSWFLWPIISISNYFGDGVSFVITKVKSLLGLSHPVKSKKRNKVIAE